MMKKSVKAALSNTAISIQDHIEPMPTKIIKIEISPQLNREVTVSLISGYESRGNAKHTLTASPEPKYMILIGSQKKYRNVNLDDLK